MTQLVAVRVYYYQIDAKLPESAQPARPPPPPRALPCISYAIGAKIMSYTMLRGSLLYFWHSIPQNPTLIIKVGRPCRRRKRTLETGRSFPTSGRLTYPKRWLCDCSTWTSTQGWAYAVKSIDVKRPRIESLAKFRHLWQRGHVVARTKTRRIRTIEMWWQRISTSSSWGRSGLHPSASCVI